MTDATEMQRISSKASVESVLSSYEVLSNQVQRGGGTEEQNFWQLGRVNGQTCVVVEQREMEFDTLKRPQLEATQFDLHASQLA